MGVEKKSTPLLSILIPVRNEGINIKIMLKILKSIIEVPHEVMVVYDSLIDNSIPIVKSMKKDYPQVKLIKNFFGNGVAGAIKTGIRKSEAEYILIFAADEVGPVLAIEDMVMLMDQGCDFVSCTRYAYGGRRLGGSMLQGIISRSANFLLHSFFGSALTDSTTGIKIFRRKDFNKIKLISNVGWAVAFEMAIKAQIQGLRLGEVPIISIDRLYGGQSSFKPGPWIKEYMKWFMYGIYHLNYLRANRKVKVRIPTFSTR